MKKSGRLQFESAATKRCQREMQEDAGDRAVERGRGCRGAYRTGCGRWRLRCCARQVGGGC
jgi:hypothetical protein